MTSLCALLLQTRRQAAGKGGAAAASKKRAAADKGEDKAPTPSPAKRVKTGMLPTGPSGHAPPPLWSTVPDLAAVQLRSPLQGPPCSMLGQNLSGADIKFRLFPCCRGGHDSG